LNLDNLPQYFKSLNDATFEWGVFDCLTFTNGAWNEMYGYGWADDWLGRYLIEGKPMNKSQLQKEFGYKSFYDAVDDRLERVEGIPPRGALVATKRAKRWAIGSALGISVGLKGAFVSSQGLTYLPLEEFDAAWIDKEVNNG
jgi:hypothetical protein